jgi:hypothetical protein
MNAFFFAVLIIVVTIAVGLAMTFAPPPPRDPGRYDVYSLSCKDGREWKGVEVSFSEGGFYVSKKGELVAVIKSDCVAEKNR